MKTLATLFALTLALAGCGLDGVTGASRPDASASAKPMVIQSCESRNVSANAPITATQNCDKGTNHHNIAGVEPTEPEAE